MNPPSSDRSCPLPDPHLVVRFRNVLEAAHEFDRVLPCEIAFPCIFGIVVYGKESEHYGCRISRELPLSSRKPDRSVFLYKRKYEFPAFLYRFLAFTRLFCLNGIFIRSRVKLEGEGRDNVREIRWIKVKIKAYVLPGNSKYYSAGFASVSSGTYTTSPFLSW